MQIDSTTSSTTDCTTSQKTSLTSESNETFASALAKAETTANSSEIIPQADFVSGRMGINTNSKGIPYQVIYMDESGNIEKKSSFNAQDILESSKSLGIPLTDLKDLGKQMDAKGIGYRPYELYRGTGSDHGIDFDDLINGGLGTAYDWRHDSNAKNKGTTSAQRLQDANDFADSIGLKANSTVTTERGIDAAKFTALTGKNGVVNPYVVYNGGSASWYEKETSANEAIKKIGGSLYKVTTPSKLENSKSVSTTQSKLIEDTSEIKNSIPENISAGTIDNTTDVTNKPGMSTDGDEYESLSPVDLMLKRLSSKIALTTTMQPDFLNYNASS